MKKLIINQLMATMLAALGEGIVLAEAADLSVTDLLDVMYVLIILSSRLSSIFQT